MKIDQSDFIRELKSMTRIMFDKPGFRPPESASENRVTRYSAADETPSIYL